MPVAGIDFRIASARDAAALVALINSAYRGESSRLGWTTEADLLGGQRTDLDEVSALIAAPESRFLLGETPNPDAAGCDLLGCLHLGREGAAASLGMFAIRPGLQGRGLGRGFMHEAEARVRAWWGSERVRMSVISLREDLIEYYVRRGYRRTGETAPFPAGDPRCGLPRVDGLEFAILEKVF